MRSWQDDAAAAGLLLSQTMMAKRTAVHVVHVASEVVPIAKVWLDNSLKWFGYTAAVSSSVQHQAVHCKLYRPRSQMAPIQCRLSHSAEDL